MSLESIFDRDLASLFNTNELAVTAQIVRNPPSQDIISVIGIFDPGFQGAQEPRSPFFRARESDLNTVRHGDLVLIDWTPYDTEWTGEIVYYVQGYQPDGWGLAKLLLETRSDIAGVFTVQGDALRHARQLDAVGVFQSVFGLNIDNLAHQRPVDTADVLSLLIIIDASADTVNKVGNVVSSIVGIDGKTYLEQGGGGITHGDGVAPTGLDRYAFDGTPSSYMLAQDPEIFAQPFTIFAVVKRSTATDMQFIDNL